MARDSLARCFSASRALALCASLCSLPLSCSDNDRPGHSAGGTAGKGGSSGHGATGGHGGTGGEGGTAGIGGDGSAGSAGHGGASGHGGSAGSAGTSPNGDASSDAPGLDAASEADAHQAGDGGPVLNGCTNYVDRTADDAARAISWVEEIADSPERCMKVRTGQTVTFTGDFVEHPLEPFGGDSPNPIAEQTTFTTPGVYGYICTVHPSMVGAIWVVAQEHDSQF